MNVKEYTPEQIDEVAAALKQVVSVPPQLLYKAAQKARADFILDNMGIELKGPDTTPPVDFNRKKWERRVEALNVRAAICHYLVEILIRSGRAELDNEDTANIIMAMQAGMFK